MKRISIAVVLVFLLILPAYSKPLPAAETNAGFILPEEKPVKAEFSPFLIIINEPGEFSGTISGYKERIL